MSTTILERVTRIELVHLLWQSSKLPLHHTRVSGGLVGDRTQ